jgi:hypothetical protein
LYYNPPTYASHTAGIRHAHQTWLVCWDGDSLTFCPGWPQPLILLFSLFFKVTFATTHTFFTCGILLWLIPQESVIYIFASTFHQKAIQMND